MGLTRLEALQILGLEEGCSEKEIRDRFKKLALKWHPDKNFHNPDEAQKKFQVISAAYSRLVSKDDDEVTITLGDIFSDFRRYYNPHAHVFCDCDICQDEWGGVDFADIVGSDPDMYSDDEEEGIFSSHIDDRYYADQLLRAFAERLYRNFNGPSRMARKARESAWEESRYKRKKNISAEEASRNADELLKAEEKEKKEAEKRKQKNKKKRDAKKKKKAKLQQDDSSKSNHGSKSKEDIREDRDEEVETLDQADGDRASDFDDDEIDIMSAFVARASKKNSHQSCQSASGGMEGGEGSCSTSTTKIKGTFSRIYEEEKENLEPECSGTERALNDLSGEPTDKSTTAEVMARSRQLAGLGNIAAKDGHFSEAVRRFSEAIDIYPFDHRYFGNRSFCYDYLQDYTCALEDANSALRLDTSWPKGYYRQGRAFAGLKRFDEAESSYIKALQLDPSYKDAEEELFKIRLEQLKSMGFTSSLSELALKEYKTVQAAIDAILAGKVTSLEIDDHAHVYSPEERLAPPTGTQKRPPPSPSPPQESSDSYTPVFNHMGFQIPPRMMNQQPSHQVPPRHAHQTPPRHAHQTPPRHAHQTPPRHAHQTPPRQQGSRQQQTSARHAQQATSKQPVSKQNKQKQESQVDINSQGRALWVGNINSSSITEGVVRKLFQQFGEISSVRLIRERRCAFVNFAKPQSAAEAIKQLQGKNVDGCYLILRYPENPLLAPATSSKKSSSASECYHWRTTGCVFGSKCRYQHIPGHKGVDL